MSKPIVGTALTGGGGYDLGAMAARCEVAWGVEIDPDIAAHAQSQLGHEIKVSKVEEQEPCDLSPVDLFHASPVCKSFSQANQGGKELESDLAAAEGVCKFLRRLTPKLFTLENVSKYRDSESFASILRCLREGGYRFEFGLFDAADFGVAQNRRRLILRAVRGGSVPPLKPTHIDPAKVPQGMESLFQEEYAPLLWRGWYGAIEDLLPGCPESALAKWQLRRLGPQLVKMNFAVTNQYDQPSDNPDRGAKVILEGEPFPPVLATLGNRARAFLVDTSTSPKPDNESGRGVNVREALEPATTVRAGANHIHRAYLIDCMANDANKQGEVRLTVSPDSQPSYTIAGSQEKRPARAWLERGRVVSLTPRCLWRLQSGPDWYALPDKTSLACTLIGNAVPPIFGQRIVESMLDAL